MSRSASGSPLSGGKDTDYPAGVWIARVERIRRILPPFVYLWITGRLHARWSDEYAWRNRDDIENDRGIPPPDERIGWHGVWIAEAFLPSTISALVSGVEKLGWWEPYRDRTISGDVAIGRSGRGGGWTNLPLVKRRTNRGMIGAMSLDRDLPDGVEYISGHVHYVTPSMTVLVVGFRFDETVSATLDAALRRRYRSYHVMAGLSASQHMSPDFQRRDAVRALERARVGACRSWLAKYLPGYFAGGDEATEAPATLLMTTRKVVPFERTEDSRYWAHEAVIGFAYRRLETGITGLRYAFRPKEDGVPALAGRESDIFANPDEWRHHGHENTTWSLKLFVDNLSGLVAFQTSDAVLRDVRRRLGRLRDSLAKLSSSSSTDLLSSVRAQLGTMSSDLTALTSEMLRWPDHADWILQEVTDVELIDDFPNPNRTKVADERSERRKMLDFYVENARDVRDFEEATRGLLIAAAAIAGALENLKLQSFVRWVTVLALIVALAALVVSGVGVAHDVISSAPSATP